MQSQNDLFKTECLRLDNCTMAAGIEARVPFLSNQIVHFSNCLPEYTKISKKNARNSISKLILRKAASEVLPSWIAWRKKDPFFSGAGISLIINEIAENTISDTYFREITSGENPYRLKTKAGILFYNYWSKYFKKMAYSFEDLETRNLIRSLKFGREGF